MCPIFYAFPPQPKVYTQTSDSVNDVQTLGQQVANCLSVSHSSLFLKLMFLILGQQCDQGKDYIL